MSFEADIVVTSSGLEGRIATSCNGFCWTREELAVVVWVSVDVGSIVALLFIFRAALRFTSFAKSCRHQLGAARKGSVATAAAPVAICAALDSIRADWIVTKAWLLLGLTATRFKLAIVVGIAADVRSIRTLHGVVGATIAGDAGPELAIVVWIPRHKSTVVALLGVCETSHWIRAATPTKASRDDRASTWKALAITNTARPSTVWTASMPFKADSIVTCGRFECWVATGSYWISGTRKELAAVVWIAGNVGIAAALLYVGIAGISRIVRVGSVASFAEPACNSLTVANKVSIALAGPETIGATLDVTRAAWDDSGSRLHGWVTAALVKLAVVGWIAGHKAPVGTFSNIGGTQTRVWFFSVANDPERTSVSAGPSATKAAHGAVSVVAFGLGGRYATI